MRACELYSYSYKLIQHCMSELSVSQADHAVSPQVCIVWPVARYSDSDSDVRTIEDMAYTLRWYI